MNSQICSFTYGLVLSALELEGLLTKGSGETQSQHLIPAEGAP